MAQITLMAQITRSYGTLNSTMRLITQKYNLISFQWSTVAPESTEGEKSPTWVKCSVRKKSNIEILMTIYDLLGIQWLVLMGSREKFRTFNFFHYFWLEIDRNFNDDDLVSVFQGAPTFFLRKFFILLDMGLKLKIVLDS